MTRDTRIKTGFCSVHGDNYEVEIPLQGEIPTLYCPLCKSVVFDIGGVLYHAKETGEHGNSS